MGQKKLRKKLEQKIAQAGNLEDGKGAAKYLGKWINKLFRRHLLEGKHDLDLLALIYNEIKVALPKKRLKPYQKRAWKGIYIPENTETPGREWPKGYPSDIPMVITKDGAIGLGGMSVQAFNEKHGTSFPKTETAAPNQQG